MKVTVPKVRAGGYQIDTRCLRLELESPGEIQLFTTLEPYLDQSGSHVTYRGGNVALITNWPISDEEADKVFNENVA